MNSPRLVPPPELAEILEHERHRQARFGQIRPAVHADWQGQKWVVVGNQLLNSPNWKTPIDFLSAYLKYTLTPAWGKAELAKPLANRHPVMQWYDAMCRVQGLAGQQAGTDGVFGVAPSGAMCAYMLLAYDLYILQHHGLLEARLLHRLRHKDQYQGAPRAVCRGNVCPRRLRHRV